MRYNSIVVVQLTKVDSSCYITVLHNTSGPYTRWSNVCVQAGHLYPCQASYSTGIDWGAFLVCSLDVNTSHACCVCSRQTDYIRTIVVV